MPISNDTLSEKLESKVYPAVEIEILEKRFDMIISRQVIFSDPKIDLTSFFISAAIELSWDFDAIQGTDIISIDEEIMRNEIEKFQVDWNVNLDGGIDFEHPILYLYQLKDKVEDSYSTGIYFLIETASEFIYFDVDQFYF